jgi:O-antigen/teichoic acid export membrane protein
VTSPDAPPVADVEVGAARMATNATWLVAGQAASKLAGFAFVLVVTRALDTRAYGQFNFAASFVPLFLIVGTWGLDIAVIREVGRDRAQFARTLASAFVVRLAIDGAAVVAALLLGLVLVRSPTALAVLALVGGALLLDELTAMVGSAFKAFERMAYFSLGLVANRIVTTLLAVVAVAAGGGIVAVSAMYLLGSAAAFVVAATALRRRFPPVGVRDVDRATVGELFRTGGPLGVASALNMALLRVDTVLLQVLQGPVAVGLYGIAYRFLDSFLFVAYGLGVVAVPRIARDGWSEEGTKGFNGVLAAMLAFYVPLAVGGAFLGKWAVTLLFGERYAEAGTAVRWLAPAAGFYAVAYLCRFSAVALGKRAQITTVAAVALTANVVANLLVIPRHGYTGAAVVTFASEVLEAVLLVVVLLRAAEGFRLDRRVAAPLLAGAAMAAALAVHGREDTAGALLGAGVYLVVLGVPVIGARVLAR